MKEATLYGRLKQLAADLKGQYMRVTDRFAEGVPDCYLCIDGKSLWVEVKYARAWPLRAGTRVQVGIQRAQVIWLRQHRSAGGAAYLLVGVGREVFVFADAFELIELGIPQAEFRALAAQQDVGVLVSLLK